MIRPLQASDLAGVAEIWLNTNLKAHDFIPAEYWQDHFEQVKQMLPLAEVYLYEEQGEIQGFIGLSGSYIAGIFVCGQAQSRGIGRKLLDYAKAGKNRLELRVYQKNARAIAFYRREQFEIQSECLDGETGEKEYLMAWEA
jgi:putative acetyltransferase